MNYIDVNELIVSSQDADNTYIGLNEYGEFVRTNIEVPEVDLSNYYTKSEVDKKIANIDIPEVDLSNYYTKREINNKGYVTDSDVNEYVGNEIAQLEEVIKTKQTKLVSGSNIKTVNGQSLLGNGNITIEHPKVDLSNYYTKQEINNKGFVTDSDVNEYVGNEIAQLEEVINTKQAKLVSGSNIKTVNGQSLLGNGNITIEHPKVDLSDYYTKEEIEDIIDEIDLTEFITENELELRITEVVGDINNILETI